MDQKDMFEQAMKRPVNYYKLSQARQWEIDGQLNILDWDGSCIHKKGYSCNECKEIYYKKYKMYYGINSFKM